MELGVEALDEQHKILVRLIDTAYRAVMAAPGEESASDVAGDLIREMKAYAVEHFAMEEAYMRQVGYPRRAEHTFMHKEFVHRVVKLEQETISLDKKVDVFLFLSDWLRTHILRADLDLADYANSLPGDSSSSR